MLAKLEASISMTAIPMESATARGGIYVMNCLRCGTLVRTSTPTAVRILCGDCFKQEHLRSDCAQCGAPKGRPKKLRGVVILCGFCAELRGKEAHRKRDTERRKRFGNELTERGIAEADPSVAEDPLGTLHFGQRILAERGLTL